MENASKALIIAGTVLIALLVISVAVYVFNTYSDFARNEQEQEANQQKIQYNTKFEKYLEKDLTLQDVVTICNMAKEYNEKYNDADAITVNVISMSNVSSNTNNWEDVLTELTNREQNDPDITYQIIQIEYNENNGIVERIVIR